MRTATAARAARLTPEDQNLQSMPDVSPTKWHLAHTTWFFETFLLQPHLRGYRVFDPQFSYLFNSYYEAVGPRHPRAARGMLSRPSVATVAAYRDAVDAALRTLIETADDDTLAQITPLIELGIAHEEQHQELLLMDIKHVFSMNPAAPAYRPAPAGEFSADGDHARPQAWKRFAGGLIEIGHGGGGFAFDNEGPRHKVWLEPFELACQPVSAGAFCDFIEDGGYRRPEFWLSDGWALAQQENWEAPLYWRRQAGSDDMAWMIFTLSGLRPLNPDEPVCHVSLYEADAFARWAGVRLPREAEWEHAAQGLPLIGHFADRGVLHPEAAEHGEGLRQMFGDVWEWTQSPYTSYPGFRADTGAIGEYNGKFMCNQFVLRGGSAITPADHIRAEYRNFFPPSARWAFSGLRLARDV